ncbi:MAG: hypothetical protein ACT4PY_00490 [Armatimonadota bacterium]
MQVLAVAVVLAVVFTLVLGRGGLPFDRQAMRTTAVAPNIISQLVQLAFALLVIFVASRITRKRSPVDFGGRLPDTRVAKNESGSVRWACRCDAPMGSWWRD